MDDFFRHLDEKIRLFVKKILTIQRSSILLVVTSVVGVAAVLAAAKIPNALLDFGSITFFVIAFGMLSVSLYKRNDSANGLSILENILRVIFPESSEELLLSLGDAWKEEMVNKLQNAIIIICVSLTVVSFVLLVAIRGAFHFNNSQMAPISIATPTSLSTFNSSQSTLPTNTSPLSPTNSTLIPDTGPILSGTNTGTPANNTIVSPTNPSNLTYINIVQSFAFTTNLQFEWDIEAAVPITLLMSPDAIVLKEYQTLIDTVAPRIAIAEVVFRGSPNFVDDEFLLLVNHGLQVDISSWSIVDDSGNRFLFPSVILNSGSALFLHTGYGESSQYHHYWAMDDEIWSQESKITLFDKENAVIDIWTIPSPITNSVFDGITD